MSHREGDIFVAKAEKPQQCDGCGRIEELRPYGPGGSMVCFDCAMKDPKGTEQRFGQVLDGKEGRPVTAAPGLVLPEGLFPKTDRRDGVLATAVMDRSRAYRYLLTRIWDTSRPPMVWVMLNPSTADALSDDATIRRCTGFARREQCGGIAVVNLFALRSTDPRALRDHPNPVGPHNDAFLRHAVGLGPVVVAWGDRGVLGDRAATVTRSLTTAGVPLNALGVTSTGQPRHPLYLPRNAVLAPYRGPTS